MKNSLDKIKVPLSVIVSAALIIGIAAAICAVSEGNSDNAYKIKESFSEITDDTVDFEKVFAFTDTELFLPENYNAKLKSITERVEKRYTEKELKTETGSITVKLFNYAYLVEDDVIKIPDNAEKFIWQSTDVFVFENSDGTCTAIYYKDLARYTINEQCSIEEMMKFF